MPCLNEKSRPFTPPEGVVWRPMTRGKIDHKFEFGKPLLAKSVTLEKHITHYECKAIVVQYRSTINNTLMC